VEAWPANFNCTHHPTQFAPALAAKLGTTLPDPILATSGPELGDMSRNDQEQLGTCQEYWLVVCMCCCSLYEQKTSNTQQQQSTQTQTQQHNINTATTTHTGQLF
jgi:hypothetical protein